MRRLVVATRSADKLREIRQILADISNVEVVDLAARGIAERAEEEGLEQFATFAENALAKARYFAELTDELVLADDSGLCVDALGGDPGVFSKRFSGRTDLSGRALDEANNALLLERLRDAPPGERSARYECAVALIDPVSGSEEVASGACVGTILAAPRGSGGFGYDPLFFVPPAGATFAEMSPERKNQLSHRAIAVRAAGGVLRRWSDACRP